MHETVADTARQSVAASGVLTPSRFIGDAGQEAYWTPPRLLAAIAALEPGVTELMCHPGMTPSRVKSGYAAQREVELATFLEPSMREALRAAGVRLIGFSDLGGA